MINLFIFSLLSFQERWHLAYTTASVFSLSCTIFRALQWRHNGRDSVSNHQPHDCLLNRLLRRRSKKTSKLCVTGLCVGNSSGTGEFPAQRASNAENVSIWLRHHVSLISFQERWHLAYTKTSVYYVNGTDVIIHPASNTFHKVWITWWRHQMETFSALLAICAGNHRSTVNSPHKGQWRGALMFYFIWASISGWVNNREAGDLRRHRAHCDVIVMKVFPCFVFNECSYIYMILMFLNHMIHLSILLRVASMALAVPMKYPEEYV